MTADFGNFNEAFEQLKDAFGGDEPPGGRKTPVWVKYVDVKAGDSIYDVLRTGFAMHAAVTGKLLIAENFYQAKVPKKEVEEIIEDLASKVPRIMSDNKGEIQTLLSDDTFIRVRRKSQTDEGFLLGLEVKTFNKDTLTFIKNTIDFHLEDLRKMDDSLA